MRSLYRLLISLIASTLIGIFAFFLAYYFHGFGYILRIPIRIEKPFLPLPTIFDSPEIEVANRFWDLPEPNYEPEFDGNLPIVDNLFKDIKTDSKSDADPPKKRNTFLSFDIERKRRCSYCKEVKTGPLRIYLNMHKNENMAITPHLYQSLFELGLLKQGESFFFQSLDTCCRNYQLRLNVEKFEMKSDYRKALKKFAEYLNVEEYGEIDSKNLTPFFDKLRAHGDYRIEIVDSLVNFDGEDNAAYSLFEKYSMDVHKTKQKKEAYKGFLVDNVVELQNGPAGLVYGFFHLNIYIREKLVGVTVWDVMPRGIISNYSFYDPDIGKLLNFGKIIALQEIQMVQSFHRGAPNFKYFYPEAWVANNSKMHYKIDYYPAEILDADDQTWINITEEIEQEILKQDSLRHLKNGKLAIHAIDKADEVPNEVVLELFPTIDTAKFHIAKMIIACLRVNNVKKMQIIWC